MLHLLLKILHLLLEIPHFLRMMRVHLRLRIVVDQILLYSVAVWWICVILHPLLFPWHPLLPPPDISS